MKDSQTTLVVTPGCSSELIQEMLAEDGSPAWTIREVLLPPDSRLQYSNLLGKNHFPGARIWPSPARSFFSTRHFKWLRDLLGSSKNTVVLVPKALYQAPQVALASLLILILSGNSITILRHQDENPGLTSGAAADLNGQKAIQTWTSFEFNKRMIANEVGRLIWLDLKPTPIWDSRWAFLYLLMVLGLLLREHYLSVLMKVNKIPSGGRNPLEMHTLKTTIIVGPGCPAGLIQETLDEALPPDQAEVEVLLPPGNPSEYANLRDRKISSGRVRFVSSPARNFLTAPNFLWLRKKVRSSGKMVMVVPKSPYRDLTLAIATPLITLLAGRTITLLRPVTEEDTRELLESCLEPSDQNLPARWITKELDLDLLLREIGSLAWYSYPNWLKRLIEFTDRELCYYFGVYQSDPANLKPLDVSPEGIEKDVNYALGNADIWISHLPGREGFLKGKRVLEIGPGVNFGTILTLACYGAEGVAVERFSSPWDPEYHPKFYARLREKLAERGASVDLTPLDMILSQGRYPQASISVHNCSLEELTGVPDRSIDLVFSNAVFEHLYDLKSAFAHLARITKAGGLGFHQVDFRDHRNLSRPLEHLLFGNREFSRLFKEKHSECGNRFRPKEMGRYLEEVGFEVREFRPDIFAEEAYLQEFLERLRQARKSQYRHFSAEDLRCVSGLFIVVKRPV